MNSRDWDRIAQRHNAAQEARMPLLASAGLVESLTAEEIRAIYEGWDRKRQALRQKQVRFAERCRRRVALRVSRAELEELDARRSNLPASSEYGADFWRTVLARLCGRNAAPRAADADGRNYPGRETC